MLYGEEKSILSAVSEEKISETLSKLNLEQEENNLKNIKLSPQQIKQGEVKVKKIDERQLKLKKIPDEEIKTLQKRTSQLTSVEEKGRLNLKSLKIPTAAEVRNSILKVKPQSFQEAQTLGWPTKSVTGPEPIENLIKAVPNELESLKPPKEKEVNKINILGIGAQSTDARLSVVPEYLTFITNPEVNPAPQTIKIKNKGTGTLSYSLSEAINWLSLSSGGGSVTTGEDVVTVSINVSGLIEENSPYIEDIVVSNNDDSNDKEYIRIRLYVMDGDGFVATNSYDANGNLVRRIDADGNVIEYEYDNANRLTKILYPNADIVSFEYDSNGNRTKTIDKTGITEYVYDQFNRLAAVLFQETAWVIYKYDNNGNVKKLIYPDGKEINYVYDADNRLIEVNYQIDSTTYTITYAYDPQTGNLISKTLPNGVVTAYLYDNADRFTDCINKKSNDELISSYHYTLDENGNRTSVEETTPQGSKTTNYEYDELNRLIETIYPNGTEVGYTYDEIGNRLTKTTNGDILSYQYDKDNRLIQAGEEIFLYDKRGNLTKRTSPTEIKQYSYDYENRLIRYEDGLKVVEYEYNGDGIRISKTVNGEKIVFINDMRTPVTQVLMECTGNWYINKRYVYGRDLISQEEF